MIPIVYSLTERNKISKHLKLLKSQIKCVNSWHLQTFNTNFLFNSDSKKILNLKIFNEIN